AIRSKVNCRVYMICTDATTSKIIGASKYVDEVVFVKHTNILDYINSIKGWYSTVDFVDKPILYFTNDNSCYYIDSYRDWFELNFELCLPSSAIIQTFTQKGLAESRGQDMG